MKLLEYQAHVLFEECGLPSSKGDLASSVNELHALASRITDWPVVVKAQVQTGGRGKAGGVKLAGTKDELTSVGKTILGLTISGLKVEKIFVTPAVKIAREMYLSIIMDRKQKCPVLIFSAEGGIDINDIAEGHPEKIVKLEIMPDQGIRHFHAKYIADYSGIPELAGQLEDVLRKLFTLFSEKNCQLAEINPLVVTEEGNLACLDGKIDIDDNALFKSEKFGKWRDESETNELILEARKWRFTYIPVEEQGNIAVISNGSGMLMSSIDLISNAGHTVCSVLDLGGGATAERIKEAVRIMLKNPRVKLLFINIFGGITRCDEVARGVLEATREGHTPEQFVLRLEGTNKAEGIEVASKIEIPVSFAEDLVDGVAKIDERMKA